MLGLNGFRRWWRGSSTHGDLTTSLLTAEGNSEQTQQGASRQTEEASANPISSRQLPQNLTATSPPPLSLIGNNSPPSPASAQLIPASEASPEMPTRHPSNGSSSDERRSSTESDTSSPGNSDKENSSLDTSSTGSRGSDSDRSTIVKGEAKGKAQAQRRKPELTALEPVANDATLEGAFNLETVAQELFPGDSSHTSSNEKFGPNKNSQDFEEYFKSKNPEARKQSQHVDGSSLGTKGMAVLSHNPGKTSANDEEVTATGIILGETKKRGCPAPIQFLTQGARTVYRETIVPGHRVADGLYPLAVFFSILEPITGLATLFMQNIGRILNEKGLLTQEAINLSLRIYPSAIAGIFIGVCCVILDIYQNRKLKTENTGVIVAKIHAATKSAALTFVFILASLNAFFTVSSIVASILSAAGCGATFGIRFYAYTIPLLERHPGQFIEISTEETLIRQRSIKFALIIIGKSAVEFSGLAGASVFIAFDSPYPPEILMNYYHEIMSVACIIFGLMGGTMGLYRSRSYPENEAKGFMVSQIIQFFLNLYINVLALDTLYIFVTNAKGAPNEFFIPALLLAVGFALQSRLKQINPTVSKLRKDTIQPLEEASFKTKSDMPIGLNSRTRQTTYSDITNYLLTIFTNHENKRGNPKLESPKFQSKFIISP